MAAREAGRRDAPVSWVRRGDRLTQGQQSAWDAHRRRYLITAPSALARASLDPRWRLDAARVFGRQAPLVVEIGTGQGENLVAAAAREPGRNYLGVEVYTPGLAKTIRRAQAADLDNLRLIQVDAPELLATGLAPAVVAELWTFFPDPWPKNRHAKRRLITPTFVQLAARVLASGGRWYLATDWPNYADQMLRVIEADPSFANLAGRGFAPRFADRVETAFERKGVAAGREVFDLAFERGSGVRATTLER